ncbi:uncharacterized protein LOC112350076 isoform X6 [Selaginella moellendorffii]|uniref:uncharacterized protein LOC112348755 isoform X6 n=1 Tax=Selaginella moellendorffii TaxID=88036 RepID=UPI000D1CF1BA|nr:uncharacterized protein LOC112348755 isoform X6 [Selaginella moellendorffii]XP_024541422.1 uncharacterized protein LOC112350076 isoform X6 [Selaginella moellendorffii]|eukprot:XP_024537678.1 uncharacterized protein LOC112348755 isoform X6 [Selaginella moellendorffii]
MAARSAGRFARRAFFNAAAPRPAARPAQPQPGFGFASSRSGARIARLQSSGLRREVLTMQPMHSVTANAWLVSRISEILVDAAEFLQSRVLQRVQIPRPITTGARTNSTQERRNR